jgi:hypothetical protein
MKLYGLIVTGSEQRSGYDNTIMTRRGEQFWVVIESDGWVPATSRGMKNRTDVPNDLKVWKTKEEAVSFGKMWKGHPWWCSPIGFEVIEIEPKFKEIFDGYNLIQ